MMFAEAARKKGEIGRVQLAYCKTFLMTHMPPDVSLALEKLATPSYMKIEARATFRRNASRMRIS
jgi:hypothetical protein